jgi:TRAP transporter TAXI family solute receptor
MIRRHVRARWLAFLIVACVVTVGCQPASDEHAATRRLSIATGDTGGVYYPYGGAIAAMISASLPHVQATAEVTAAAVDNLKLIRDRNADLGFTQAGVLADAVAGQGPFEQGGAIPARALAVLYNSYLHVIIRDNPDVVRIADLKGKSVSIGAAGSGTELVAKRVLAAAGLDPARDIVAQSLGVSQSVDQLKDGKIDAFFWISGVPAAAVLDLANTPGVHWRFLRTDDLVPALASQGVASPFVPLIIPKTAYAGMPADVGVLGVGNVLVVHKDMPEQLAYDITRLLFEKQAQLIAVHREATKLSLATAVVGSAAPFHPGAIRYYRERGAWKE